MGDASLLVSPLQSQSMNAGINDAYNLGWFATIVERRALLRVPCSVEVNLRSAWTGWARPPQNGRAEPPNLRHTQLIISLQYDEERGKHAQELIAYDKVMVEAFSTKVKNAKEHMANVMRYVRSRSPSLKSYC
jgi:hypothetical protein